jgi:putative FmdB family regulatory protein
MPLYEYYCEKCQREVSVTMSMSERERGGAACPGCGSRDLRPLVGTFFSKTSRKS